MGRDDAHLPVRIGNVVVPQDPVSAAAWAFATTRLPTYLFSHSVRSYCWGAAIAAREGLAFEQRILWPAALLHDVGLTRVGRSPLCFEYDGAELARRFVVARGMSQADAERIARAIVLHMAPNVSVADGVEGYLLDRATAIDVRGVGADLIADVREPIEAAFPRGAFDRLFLAAIRREVAIRTDCQSARVLAALVGWPSRKAEPGARPHSVTARVDITM